MMEGGILYGWVGVIPYALFGILFLIALLRYVMRARALPRILASYTWTRLIWAAVIFRVVFAALQTALQYRVWAAGGLGTLLLNNSLNASLPIPVIQWFPWIFGSKHGYFILYVLLHFWVNVALSIFGAWVLFKFLRALRGYNGRFFEDGETELGFLMALIVGWPAITVFIPFCFVFVVVVSLVRLLVYKEAYTTLGWPFLIAAAATLLIGGQALAVSGLSVLAI